MQCQVCSVTDISSLFWAQDPCKIYIGLFWILLGMYKRYSVFADYYRLPLRQTTWRRSLWAVDGIVRCVQ